MSHDVAASVLQQSSHGLDPQLELFAVLRRFDSSTDSCLVFFVLGFFWNFKQETCLFSCFDSVHFLVLEEDEVRGLLIEIS